jgi:hypothetical protein
MTGEKAYNTGTCIIRRASRLKRYVRDFQDAPKIISFYFHGSGSTLDL